MDNRYAIFLIVFDMNVLTKKKTILIKSLYKVIHVIVELKLKLYF